MPKKININHETLIIVLNKMFGKKIISADWQIKKLHGGTVGEVCLVTGTAETADGEKLPYKVVLKIQEKWFREPNDEHSWRREYDLYTSDLDSVFCDSDMFRWAKCYHAEMNDAVDETQLWIEYIDGISGNDLTTEMRECASREIGRFQGRIYKQHMPLLKNITCFAGLEYSKDYFTTFRRETKEYRYIRSKNCEIPEHLRQMIIDNDNETDAIFEALNKLPVLCHRDFWFENIFFSDGKITALDWDCAGWGYIFADVFQLMIDEADGAYLEEYYRKFIPAYLEGISEYIDVSQIINIDDDFISKLLIMHVGYNFVDDYMSAESPDEKNEHLEMFQNLYEMRNIKFCRA